MSEAPSDQEKSEKDEDPKKRAVRRVIVPPSPQDLRKKRQERLKEALLDNSRAIHDQLVVWDTDDDLEVPITIQAEFDGHLLVAYYQKAGYPNCRMTTRVEGPETSYVLVFPSGDVVLDLEAVVEGACEESAPAPAKKTSKKRSSKAASATK